MSPDSNPTLREESESSSTYDQILYPGQAYQDTHPDRLAVMAILYGMQPPPVQQCRVLEIGCGDGANLIPMAFGLPKSEFIGIDLAAKPIEQARTLASHAGISNITFLTMDLMEIRPDFGQFDYIIAHGFYSWVPPRVEEKLFDVCSQHLSPTGVAFISYNAYPGCHLRKASRDMMLFHIERSQPTDRVQEATAFLKFALDTVNDDTFWKVALREEVKRIDQRSESVTFHDELNPNYSPAYFADFVRSAERNGLQFLSEAKLKDMIAPSVKHEALVALERLAKDDLIVYQQYLDFLTFKAFRRTLLCRQGLTLQRNGLAERMGQLWIASSLKESKSNSGGAVEFVNHRGPGMTATDDPVVIAALRRLEQIWPQGEPFEELLAFISACLSTPLRSDGRTALAENVLKLAAATLVNVRTYRLPLSHAVSHRPTASLLTRLQAEEGNLVTTLLHTNIEIKDEQTRRFLKLLDGTRDQRALVQSMATEYPGIPPQAIGAQVNNTLKSLNGMGLLVA